MRPNLTIQLNRSRKNSSLDIHSNQTGFMTPTDQTISTPVYPPPNPQFATNGFPLNNGFQGNKNGIVPQSLLTDPTDSITPVASRNDSSFSLYSDDEIMGDSQTQQYAQQQPALTRTSSIASSVAGDSFIPNINFTKTFDTLIMSTYQSYVNKPDITPFDPRYPPSGIASRVSRDVLKISINDRVAIDYNLKKTEELWMNVNLSYTLTLIRRRLFELCGPNPSQHSSSIDDTPIEMTPFLSRQSSAIGQPELGRQNSTSSQSFIISNGTNQLLSQGHKPSWLHLNNSFMTHRLSSTDSLVENVNLHQQPVSRNNSIPTLNTRLGTNTPPTLSLLSRWTSNDTDFEMSSRKDDFISQQTFFQPPQFPSGSNLTPPQQQMLQLEDQQLESPFHPSFNLISATNNVSPHNGLQSPFSETATRKRSDDGCLEVQDPLYNATHNRKRDSLIKKRGGR